jgi:methyl-accepting chemotaxis protein
VGSVTQASEVALQRSEMVAAAGDALSVSARLIASQIHDTAAEIASTARAGERAREIIKRLAGAVSQIGTVANLIGEIASRTNLLALNATIESARAGDAGRGFAVVAVEVKSLATQTALSTGEITRNAREIEQATRDAVQVVSEMVERVATIERITQSVATAAEEQTAATREIARNVVGTSEAMRVVSGQIVSVTEEARGTDAAVTEMRALAGTIGDNITELRSVMVRIVRTSSDSANRREGDRVSVNIPATLMLNGRELRGVCLDLSRGGTRVRMTETLTTGCSMIMRLPGLPELPGQVLEGGEEVSLRCAWDPDSAPAALEEMVCQLAAA